MTSVLGPERRIELNPFDTGRSFNSLFVWCIRVIKTRFVCRNIRHEKSNEMKTVLFRCMEFACSRKPGETTL